MKKQKIYPITAFALCLAAEVAIGMFAHGWLRNSFGDILVMPTLYFLIRIFTDKLRRTLPLILFVFACFVELMQGLHICDILGIPQGSILRIIIGTTALWSDILCYAAGMIVIYAIMNIEYLVQGGLENDKRKRIQ